MFRLRRHQFQDGNHLASGELATEPLLGPRVPPRIPIRFTRHEGLRILGQGGFRNRAAAQNHVSFFTWAKQPFYREKLWTAVCSYSAQG